jgi:hypothetical protein
VLKENVTHHPSFDPLLRHLHRKKNVFHKSDSSNKKLHALVTLLFILDFTYIPVYGYLNILLKETTLLKRKYIILGGRIKNIPYHQNMYTEIQNYAFGLCHSEKNLF